MLQYDAFIQSLRHLEPQCRHYIKFIPNIIVFMRVWWMCLFAFYIWVLYSVFTYTGSDYRLLQTSLSFVKRKAHSFLHIYPLSWNSNCIYCYICRRVTRITKFLLGTTAIKWSWSLSQLQPNSFCFLSYISTYSSHFTENFFDISQSFLLHFFQFSFIWLHFVNFINSSTIWHSFCISQLFQILLFCLILCRAYRNILHITLSFLMICFV